MQYASVIIDHRAGFEPLTYSIPAKLLAHLDRGSVVLVPFGPTKVHGVIDRFLRIVPAELRPKLKPITSIVYPGASVESSRIEAAHTLRSEYGASLGQTLFRLLPELPLRQQKESPSHKTVASDYQIFEYQLPLNTRVEWYTQLANRVAKTGQKSIVIVPNSAAAEGLFTTLCNRCKVTLYPKTPTPKLRRGFWLGTTKQAESNLVIGTRGVLVSSLSNVGSIVIDEPWLPGHKEDTSPKLWTIQIAQALCQAQNIPLITVSSLLWPETRLFGITHSKPAQTLINNRVEIIPKRPLAEQVAHWLAQTQNIAHRAIVIHETKQDTLWCSQCKKTVSSATTCRTCQTEPILLPQITCQSVREQVSDREVEIIASEQVWYRQFNALLAINFDAYLTITDFRAKWYILTLFGHLLEQSRSVSIATSQPDVWTRLTQPDSQNFERELAIRHQHRLPPYSLLVRLTANQKDVLTKLLPLNLPSLIQVGPIHQHFDHYVLTILLKPHTTVPPTWAKSPGVKVDILPLYLNS